MKKKKPGAWRDKINASRRIHKPDRSEAKEAAEAVSNAALPRPIAKPRPRPRPNPAAQKPAFEIVEREVKETKPVVEKTAFRVLIAVHRPRFRGRAERAAALVGWEVTALLNKQDPVGQVSKPPRPPDLLVISGDFGRQKDYAIFRAVQAWRQKGMKIIGLVDDCDTAPENHPDLPPSKLCDVCLPPPYRASDLRVLFSEFYEQMCGEPAPPPKSAGMESDAETDEE